MSDEIESRFPFRAAADVAQSILDRLRPCCERMQVAGSIRRLCKEVGDIEILLIPKMMDVKIDLIESVPVSAAGQEIEAMIEAGTITKRLNSKGSPTWGPLNKYAVHVASGIPVDFFNTTAENWWVSLVVRTGSAETNLLLAKGANRQNKTLQSYGAGVLDRKTGAVEVCTSEEQVFRACGVPYRQPKDR